MSKLNLLAAKVQKKFNKLSWDEEYEAKMEAEYQQKQEEEQKLLDSDPDLMKCWCGAIVKKDQFHYPGGNDDESAPEDGPKHLPSAESPYGEDDDSCEHCGMPSAMCICPANEVPGTDAIENAYLERGGDHFESPPESMIRPTTARLVARIMKKLASR